MSRRIGARSAVTLVLSVLIATLGAGPVPVAGHGPLPATAAPPHDSVDLAPTLGTDGTFHGVPGVAGSVDTSAWTLVSNLAAGEPPRFAPAATTGSPSTAATGPWSAMGSNAGNGALNGGVLSLVVSGSDLYVGGYFTDVAGIPEADYIAKWDGSAWSALGSNGSGNGAISYAGYCPRDACVPEVDALAVSGSDLYVGGDFADAGGIPEADYVAEWDGSAWSALGSDGSGDGAIFYGGFCLLCGASVDALAVSDGDLYVGGFFTNAAGIPEADNIATWNGSAWSALGSNGSGDGALPDDGLGASAVVSIAVSGADLYVGGGFTNAAGIPEADYVAKWDGSAWSALGSNGSGDGAIPYDFRGNASVNALAVSGTDLYVGGYFHDAAGIPEADFVALWSGSVWSALGSNGSGDGAINNEVDALAVSGTDLYVGGFTYGVGIPEGELVAKWNGSVWSALGLHAGNGPLSHTVYALAVSGANLYVGGSFADAAGIPQADNAARLNGSGWSALGSGSGDGAVAPNSSVYALAVSGVNLYVGGGFTDAAGISEADYIARWNGSAWSALSSNGHGDGALNDFVDALAVSGTNLYVGGAFTNAAGFPDADYIAKWNGSAWSALSSNGHGGGALNDWVNALAVSGADLYVGGNFTNAAHIAAADFIAKWNGSTWSALGSNRSGDGALSSSANALAVSGSDVYVGGFFTDAAGIARADYIAKWNGSRWSALGSNGHGNGALDNWVDALAVSGSNLYVGGYFEDAAGIPEADFVAKWDGSHWSALGSNGSGNGAITDVADCGLYSSGVDALTVSGANVYVGGCFTDAAGIARADYVAKWDGSRWSALGSNGSGDGAINNEVYAFTVSSSDVYVGGDFTNAAGIPEADAVAKWDTSGGAVHQPDARIRLGTGAYVGNNIYNTSAAGQKRSGSAKPGHSLTFGISIQNDGTVSDRFTVKATGTTVSGYRLKYFSGSMDITAAVVAGTYETASLAPGAKVLITAKVTVKPAADPGGSLVRRVTLTSVGDPNQQDAVKLIGKPR